MFCTKCNHCIYVVYSGGYTVRLWSHGVVQCARLWLYSLSIYTGHGHTRNEQVKMWVGSLATTGARYPDKHLPRNV